MEKNHSSVVKSVSGYSDSPHPKVSLYLTSLHIQLYCISYIQWNECFSIKRVHGNIISKLISQQGYTTPAHLRRVQVDTGTALTWLAEWLCFTCETVKSCFSHVAMSTYKVQAVESTVVGRHFHTEMLNKNRAKRSCHCRLGMWFIWDLLLHHSLDSVTEVRRPAGPSICLNMTQKQRMWLEVCVILDYCFTN